MNKYTIATLGTVLALGAAAFLTGIKSPTTVELQAAAEAAEARWMDDVARDAFENTPIDQEIPKWLNPDEFTPEIAAKIETLDTQIIPSAEGARRSDSFHNIELLDQHGRTLRFYDDLVKDRSVCIVYFYTRCVGSCPGTTVTLKHLREKIAAEFPGDQFKFISLTLEPEVDSPEELQEYRDRYNISESDDLPEWIFATGKYEELDALRRELGIYDLDPVIDADKTEHAAIVTFGNDRTDRWAALPIGMGVNKVAETVVRIAGNTHRQRYASTIFPRHAVLEEAVESCCKSKTETASCCEKDATASCCEKKDKPSCCQDKAAACKCEKKPGESCCKDAPAKAAADTKADAGAKKCCCEKKETT